MMLYPSSNHGNSSGNSSPPFDYIGYCVRYLDIRDETRVEINLKLTAYIVAFILAVVGNGLVIAIVFKKTQFKTTTNLFIINMALSDVMMAIVCMPPTIYAIASQSIGQSVASGWLGILLCKLLPFLQGLSIAVSILTLTALAGDRFVAIVYPFRNLISKTRAKVLIVVIWFIGGCFNGPILYSMTLHEGEGVPYCRENWEPHLNDTDSSRIFTIILFVFLYVVPLTLITFFYAALVRELWQGSSLHSNQTRAFSENKSVLKMVLTVVVVFAICWLPMHVIPFIVLFATDPNIIMCGIKPSIVFIGWYMGHSSTAINPIVYLVFNENFRREVIKMFTGLLERCARRHHVTSRPFPESRASTTRQTHAVSISSNDDKSTVGRANDAFEMVSENGVARK